MGIYSIRFRGQGQKCFLAGHILLQIVIVINDVLFGFSGLGAPDIFVYTFFYNLSWRRSIFWYIFEPVPKIINWRDISSSASLVSADECCVCQKLCILLHLLFILGWIDQLVCSNKLHLLLLLGLINQSYEVILLEWVVFVTMLEFYIFFSLSQSLQLLLKINLFLARIHHL